MAPVTRCLVLSGGSVADGPYGIDHLRDFGYQLVEVHPAGNRLHRKVRDVIEHRSGMPWDRTLRSIALARSSDIVLAFLEREALTAAAFSRRGLAPYGGRPLAMLACWLADELREMPADLRHRAAARFKGVDLTIVFSANQIDILVDSGFSEGSVEAVPFGHSPELFPYAPRSDRTMSVAAVGFDRGRDYATLIDAVRDTPVEVDLICSPGNIVGIDLPENVRFHGMVPFGRYREVLSTAQVIAVPTHERAYPSGQTVALEAGATGACLVITSTPALREYFSPDTALLCPPGDVDAWRTTLLEAAGNADLRARYGDAAASDISTRFTYRQMWQRIDELFRKRGWVSG